MSDFRRMDSREGGFTLVELLIVVTLLGVVGAAMTTFLISSSRVGTRVNETAVNNQTARVAVEAITRELRTASKLPLNQVTPAFVIAEEDRIVFYARLDSLTIPTRIEVVRVDDSLVLRQWDPTTTTPEEWDDTVFPDINVPLSASVSRVLANGLSNDGPVFTYFERNAGSANGLRALDASGVGGLSNGDRLRVIAVGLSVDVQQGPARPLEADEAETSVIVRLPNLLIS